MEEKKYLIWLSLIEGVGSKTIEKLIDFYGSAKRVYDASEKELSAVDCVHHSVIRNIMRNKDISKVEELILEAQRMKINILDYNDGEYPVHLRDIYDPPYILYEKGQIIKQDKYAIAIVGARKASAYGKWAAYTLAGELAKLGITVVSGLAYGIDTCAHKGALDNNGRTIAVLGCGVDICYPPSNLHLMEQIVNQGAVISQYPISTQPLPQYFPSRNRIISGISMGVVVVEATIKSGSLITADFALEQGREVFAVPGNINSSLSQGTNKLIREGAKIVTDVQDILDELNLELLNNPVKNLPPLSETESKVFHIIEAYQPIHMEELLYKIKFSSEQLSSIITILQLKGMIDQLPGKILIIKK
ncbi:MAG: DNA-processing protein DprA [Bacillota bacterium]